MTRSRARSALVWKIFFATAAVVAVVLAGTMVLVSAAARRTADAALGRGLEQTRRHVAALLDGRERALTSAALVFAQNPGFRSLVLKKEPADLLDQANEAVLRTGATWVQITDEQGVRLAKSDEPTAARTTLAGTGLVGGALGGEMTSGAGVAGDTAIFQGVAVPILVGPSQVAGVLMAASAIDSGLANAIERETASEVVFYLVDTTGAIRIVASTLAHDSALLGFLRSHHPRAGEDDAQSAPGVRDSTSAERAEALLGGRRWLGQRDLLRSAAGQVLGGVMTLRSRDAEVAPFTTLRNELALAGLLGLAVAFVLSYAVARRISQPILALADAARRAAAGDYVADVGVRADGEIGTLAEAVRSMLSGMQERQTVAEYLRTPRPEALGHGMASARLLASITGGPFAPGRTIANRYEIEEVLGVGGAGVVYKAVDREIGETVAIKALRPEALAGGVEAIERLRSEIRLARRISHRNVVRTHDIGEVSGVYFITMEYVAGIALDELLTRDRSLPVSVTLSLGRQLCRALEVAHEQGIIHRDIKPQNLMLRPDGVLKVMDFGVARLTERTGRLTAIGLAVGTPMYMAPEQLLDEPIDERVDVYAAGVVLYECLAGRPPFEADTIAALIAKVVAGDPTAPRAVNPEISEELSAIVMRALAKNRQDRPRSAAELHDELLRIAVRAGVPTADRETSVETRRDDVPTAASAPPSRAGGERSGRPSV